MTANNRIRISVADTDHAVDVACSEVQSAVGLPVQAQFQEIDGNNLIIELQVGHASLHTPHPSRLAATVDEAAGEMEVLSSWMESPTPGPAPRPSPDVMGVGHEPLPHVAQRAFDDDLPTARWDRADSSWHLAVPSLCRGRAIVGMSSRRGYSHRFSGHDVAALRCGLAS